MPGYFHGDTRVYIYRKNPSMWEIIHMHANPRVIFRTRRENTRAWNWGLGPLRMVHPAQSLSLLLFS